MVTLTREQLDRLSVILSIADQHESDFYEAMHHFMVDNLLGFLKLMGRSTSIVRGVMDSRDTSPLDKFIAQLAMLGIAQMSAKIKEWGEEELAKAEQPG